MSEIVDQKLKLTHLLVGLYVKRTYFKISGVRSGRFLQSPDEPADRIRQDLAEMFGRAHADVAKTVLEDALKLASQAIGNAMRQIGFDPASENHAAFCTEITNAAHQGDIAKLRDLMKVANDKSVAEASNLLKQSLKTAAPEPTTAFHEEIASPSLPANANQPPPNPRNCYTPVGRFKLDRSLLSAGDRLIHGATGGHFSTLESLFDKLAEADRIALAKPAIISSTSQVPSLGNGPEGNATRVRAAELFADTLRKPDDDKLLDFEVTVYEWSDRHPRVPEIDYSHRFEIEDLRLILWAMEHGYNSVLTGPPGCGKTTVTREIAARLQRPWYRIPMHGDMSKRDMLGGFKQITTPQGPETRWFDGLLTQAIQTPAILDVDEIDRADPDLQYVAHQVYEGEGITILEDEGRFIPPHADVAIIATANSKGRADGLNRYQMINEMSEATRDRFSIWLDMDYKSPDEEAEILHDRGVIKTVSAANNIIKVANLIRNAYKQGQISTTCSFRQLEVTARFASFCKDECEAVRRILYGRAPTSDDARAVSQLAQQVYGASWKSPAR